jgi:hypothetical protein
MIAKTLLAQLLLLQFTSAAVAPARGTVQWIVAETGGAESSAVSHYRCGLSLEKKPKEFMVDVTGDAVFRLFVNGVPVANGPASGDLNKWRYDRVDLAPHLVAGDNILAAVVWYPQGAWAGPVCFMGTGPGFYLKSDSLPRINTGSGHWLGYSDLAYSPQKRDPFRAYYALGDFEKIDGRLYPWGWEMSGYDDSAWSKPSIRASTYNLVPRKIPMLEYRRERLIHVRKSEGVEVPEAFLAGKHPVTIHPNTLAIILLDRGELSNAYPELTLSGGRDAVVDMGYAESLFESAKVKGDRDAVEGKIWAGSLDRIISDGGENHLYRPLWFRTFRYIRLKIQTAEEPLTLVDLSSETVGYPFSELAVFDADDPELERIWDVGWRTLRLCAVDNFYDCPYYERLQYTGDTRIEALVSVYVSGDDRLMRKAIELYADSRGEDELTKSRYPSNVKQVIPPFSNWWIAMVDDYRMLNGDKEFIQAMTPGIEAVLTRFERFTDESGLVVFSRKNEWDFVDWAGHLHHANKQKQAGGEPSGLLSLNHVYALDRAAKIMHFLGDETKAGIYETRSRRIRDAVYAQCWDEEKGVLANEPAKKHYSEHTNLLGILTDAIPQAQQKTVMEKILAGAPEMTRATIYFRFYYNRALVKTGLADRYLDTLDFWREQLKLNLSTWAEKPEPARSDCHAWGSSPNYELLATVAGITPSESGFSKVRIAPALGALNKIDARMPHAKGTIKVVLQRTGPAGISGQVSLPDGVIGTFEWAGKILPLKSGMQTIKVE